MLDLKAPDHAPRWLSARGPFGSIDQWIARQAVGGRSRGDGGESRPMSPGPSCPWGTAFLANGRTALRNRSRNRVLGPERRRRSRKHSVRPTPAGESSDHSRVVGDDRDRHVVIWPARDRSSTAVHSPSTIEHGVLGAVALDEGVEGAKRVLDRGLRSPAGYPSSPSGRWAAAEKIDPLPIRLHEIRGGTRVHGSWLELRKISGEDRAAVRLRELELLQGPSAYWSGIGEKPELRAAVAEVPALVDLRVVIEGAPRGPGAASRRHVGDRPPPRAPESSAECKSFAGDHLRSSVLGWSPRLRTAALRPRASCRRRNSARRASRFGRGSGVLEAVAFRPRGRHRYPAKTRCPGPPSGRSSRRTRAGRPCRAIP